MFSNTAYEAFYTAIGLYLHEASIEIITSYKIFVGVLILIFGVSFFWGAWHFASRYLPGALVAKKALPLSFLVKLILCLFIGFSLLKVGSESSPKKLDRSSWHDNAYIESRVPVSAESFRVSFIFDVLTRSADEVAHFSITILDHLFAQTNSEKEAPSFFYKAILYAGSDTIENPELRDKLSYYTEECFSRVIPTISDSYGGGALNNFFRTYPEVDQALKKIELPTRSGASYSCLDLKDEVVYDLQKYAEEKTGNIPPEHFLKRVPLKDPIIHRNLKASQALTNYFWENKENFFGLQKGAIAEGGAAKAFQFWSRIRSFDGVLHILGLEELEGSSLYAERIQKFSEYLKRAPHLAGMIKMILIMIFPWLIFFLAAGSWRPLVFWTVIYFSVVMWAPIWTLFYHMMTSIALSTEVMAEFGELSDGISLYSADLITSRLYQFYAVYAWIQLLSGPMLTAFVAIKFFPWMKDNEQERAPEIIQDASSAGSTVVSHLK